MSDSLREQMLKAGFKETTPAKKQPNPKRHKGNKARRTQPAGDKPDAKRAEQEAAAAAEKRKAIKARIRALIEQTALKEYAGDIAHSYTLGNRIKQIYVNDSVRPRIISGELVITRLNGATYVVPRETGDQVLELNPDWVVVKPGDASDSVEDEYAAYKVPDDLQW